jgi:transposase
MRCKFFEILAKEKEEIRRRIEEEKDVKVMLRLFLLRFVAQEMGVGNAAAMIGMKPRVAYTWITRWLSKGYEGLLPKKRTGRPPKLNKAQKEKSKS